MRVALLTNLTSRASLPVLELLASSSQVELAHIYFYDTLTDSRRSPLEVLRQFGWKKVANKLLETLSSKIRVKFGQWLGTNWVEPRSAFELAIFRHRSWSLTTNINESESLKHLQQLDIDVLLVCVCKNILRSELLKLGRPCCINIHPSLLPKYRGPSPTFWMLYHGERQTGYSIHRMTERVDQGEVLAQRALPLDRHQSELEIELQVFQAAAEALEETLLTLTKPTLPPVKGQTPQSFGNGETDASPREIRVDTSHDTAGSYHSYPTLADRRELKKRLVS